MKLMASLSFFLILKVKQELNIITIKFDKKMKKKSSICRMQKRI